MGLRVLASCDEIWVCGQHISNGMSREIAEAKRLGIPIHYLSANQILEGSDVSYYPKKRGIELEEAPSSTIGMRLSALTYRYKFL